MATTTIPWGDGSGDNIYLTYSASTGDQTVLVSSDANGGAARQKVITFVSSVGNISRSLTVLQESGMDYVSITWNDVCITYNDTAIAYPWVEPYIVFVDSEVERVLLANGIGDGVGIKPSDAAQVTTMRYFSDNTVIESFDELKYFTGLPANGGNMDFSKTTNLKYVTIPSQITTMPMRCFAYPATYASLERITFENDHPITFNQYAFQYDNALQAVHIKNLDNWLHNTYSSATSNPLVKARHLYLNGVLVTSIYLPDDMSTIPAYFAQGMSDITSFTIPSRVTSIGERAFEFCTGLTGNFTVPSSIQNFNGNEVLEGCSSITNLYIYSDTTDLKTVSGGASQTAMVGDGTGVLHIYGDVVNSQTDSRLDLRFKKIIIDGDYTRPARAITTPIPEQIRIGGDYTYTGGSGATQALVNASGAMLSFVEIMGVITSSYSIVYNANSIANGAIIHLGYDTVTNNALPCAPNIAAANSTRVAKIYVGNGSSASHDNAILAKYTADADWSAYASKLDTWYNYINDQDANQDYIN